MCEILVLEVLLGFAISSFALEEPEIGSKLFPRAEQICWSLGMVFNGIGFALYDGLCVDIFFFKQGKKQARLEREVMIFSDALLGDDAVDIFAYISLFN